MTGPVSRVARDARGQATVELVALLPLLAAVALAVGQLLASGSAREVAGGAAQAGAMALTQGGDPERAARAAMASRWGREAEVLVRGRTVSVTLQPRGPIPGLGALLAVRGQATAGP